MAESRFAATLDLEAGFRFSVSLDDHDAVALQVDELPPLGEGIGPSPARLLATAVGHCLGSSLLFCLRKARIEPAGLRVWVEGAFVRNERGRLRVGSLSVRLEPGLDPEQHERAARCFEIFEDYCVVTESVRAGLPVEVSIAPAAPAATPPG